MRFLAIILSFLPLWGFSTSLLEDYEACWCYPSEVDSMGKITKLEPIVYPLPVKRNGVWGAIDKEGNVVEEFNYTEPVLYTDKGRVVLKNFKWENHQWDATENSKLSILDSAGAEVKSYPVRDVYKGTFLARIKEDHGLLDSKMKELLPFEYRAVHHKDEVFEFNDKGYLTMRQNKPGGNFGAVNHKGKTIIAFNYKLIAIKIENEDYIYAMNQYLKRGYINIKGQTTLSFVYDKVPRTVADSNRVETEKYIYFLDKNLKQIGPRYEAFERKGDLWFFKINGKWGIKDLAGKEVIPPVYGSIMDGPRMKDNKDFRCYIVEKSGKYGMITVDGETIIKPQYACLCGISYFAPESYYIEFQNEAGVSYKYNHEGTLVEKGGKSSGLCFCE